MGRTTWFYWMLRATVATPIALSTTLTYVSWWFFDAVFGVAHGFKRHGSPQDLGKLWRYLFTFKLQRP